MCRVEWGTVVGRKPENEAKRGVGLNKAGPWATVTQNRGGRAGSEDRNQTSNLGGG